MDSELFGIIDIDPEIPAPKKRTRKKGVGWFWISREAALFLLKNKASAQQICGYLLLACYSDRTGTFTSVNYRAFRNHLSISQGDAHGIIDDLRKFEINGQPLVYDYSDWFDSPANHKDRNSLKIKSFNMYRSKPKWCINTFGKNSIDMIWFSKELIEGSSDLTPSLVPVLA